MELKKVMDHADAVKESVINHRRKIHTFAELGGKEFKTKKYILELVKRLDLPYEEVTDTALIEKDRYSVGNSCLFCVGIRQNGNL